MDFRVLPTVLKIGLFLLIIQFSHSANAGSSCQLLDIPVQENFDLDSFEGKWFVSLKTGVKDSLLAFFMEIYDGRIHFRQNAAGGYDLQAVGSKFYGGWCPRGKGTAVVKDAREPQRMTMYFDTSIGRKVGMKPAWVLKTDYNSYAVFYSCWKETSAGACHPDNTYAFVMQRGSKPLPSGKLEEVATALKGACVDIEDLSPVTHYGYCQDKDGL
ncbi:retinol-binding protein 4-like isoform X3 [Dreissena polymorpha]|uniref:retinol-binding protein 4-like isoform X2 n=1 Tax=Dreissena polymorpha TaxID=45954 RepID=UPI002263B6B5|nr:retinol-binding protein 4-like isoform X2 [Dreissena polymorpha]XP_052236998.1 retinol-binding protein 4-like isoform X3 [Dreissena polymorpha]